jgi:hypothetical protein
MRDDGETEGNAASLEAPAAAPKLRVTAGA